jgi:hypothetical protein
MTSNNAISDKRMDLHVEFWNTGHRSQSAGSNGLPVWPFGRSRKALRPTNHAPRISDLPAIVAERGLTGLEQPSGYRGHR